ncbi:MAG: phosphoenolpyruvate carboxykinase (ATP) [Pyrinomonadaceae bacterium]
MTKVEDLLGAIGNSAKLHSNLNTERLYEEIILRHEGLISHGGAIVVNTGEHTGRAAKDKAIVVEASSERHVHWSDANKRFPMEKFEALKTRMIEYAKGVDLFVQDLYAGADPQYRLSVKVITERAWHSLFARNLLIRGEEQVEHANPDITIVDLPGFTAEPERDGTRSPVFILLDLNRGLVLIGGTSYAGEIKKSVFSVLNYLLPQRRVFSMHCSANVGRKNKEDVAIFFGLSGTGKTTLSADPERDLIGDDEHGWSDTGVFNFEGGCYAKVIRLSPEAEPEIYRTTQMFGTVLENVAYDKRTREIDLDDASLTENTRAGYPLTSIPNIVPSALGSHPRNIIMLSADAFGVLPPVSKLTPEQAMYHFLSGYTAKVAGTEKGVGLDPEATFSTCFGAPFMILHPKIYAGLLGERMRTYGVRCWLVNTGWSGGAFGEGNRIKLKFTRAMIHAILDGTLDTVETIVDSVFRFSVPVSCPGVPNEILVSRNTWKNKQAYDRQAQELARRFNENFQKFAADVSSEILNASPRVEATATNVV